MTTPRPSAGAPRRLRIIYDVEGWAFAHTARALQKYAPPDFDVSIAPMMRDRVDDPGAALGSVEPDLVFVMHTGVVKARIVNAEIRARGWRPRVVGGWSAGWPLRVEEFPARRREADLLIVNNELAWERLGRPPGTVVCPLGVDLDVFRLTRPIEARPPRVLWTGSEFWRAVKGYDDYVVPLARCLEALGIPTSLHLVDSRGRDVRPPHAMADWYNTGTVLVCASAAEGTPNPALEAAACGCVVVSTPVGNMPELIRSGENGYLVERSVDALLAGVRAALADHATLAGRLHADVQAWSWARRSAAYFAAFRRVAREATTAAAPVTA
jgi:glycosyltransferase involved in cell wall biosynthesis